MTTRSGLHPRPEDRPHRRLGLRQNAVQFTRSSPSTPRRGMLGQERTVLPLLGEQEFGLLAYTAGLTFILAFGLAKAATNYLAGTWSDLFGRKPVLVAGWLVAVPVPLLLIWAPTWGWVIFANVLLGISQGLTWSTTVVMKIDLVVLSARPGDGLPRPLPPSPRRRHRRGHRLPRRVLRAASGTVPARHRLRRPRPGPVHPGCARDRGHARLEAANHLARADGRHDHLHAS